MNLGAPSCMKWMDQDTMYEMNPMNDESWVCKSRSAQGKLFNSEDIWFCM